MNYQLIEKEMEIDKRLRRLRTWMVAGWLVASVAVTLAATIPRRIQELEASRFVVEDGRGIDRAVIGMDGDHAAFILRDDEGIPRASIRARSDVALITLYRGTDALPAATLAVEENGASRLELRDERGTGTISLTAGNGQSELALEMAAGSASLTVTGDGAQLELTHGENRGTLTASPSAVSLAFSREAARATLQLAEESARFRLQPARGAALEMVASNQTSQVSIGDEVVLSQSIAAERAPARRGE